MRRELFRVWPLILLFLFSLAGLGRAADSDLYVVEPFNYPDNTTSVPNWQVNAGTWKVMSGIYEQSNSAVNAEAVMTTPNITAANYMVRVRVRTKVPGANPQYQCAKVLIGNPGLRFIGTSYGGDLAINSALVPDPTYTQTVFGRVGYNYAEWNTWTFMILGGVQVEVYYNDQFAGAIPITGNITGPVKFQSANCQAQYDDLMISYLWEKDDIDLKIVSATTNKQFIYTTADLPLTFNLTGTLKTALAQGLANRTLQYSIKDAAGAVVQSGSFPVTETTTFTKSVTFNTTRTGFYGIDATLYSGSRELMKRSAGFGVNPTTSNTGNGDLFSMWEIPPTDPLAVKVGAQTYQQAIYWRYAYDGPGGTFNVNRIPLNPGYNPLMRITMLPGEAPSGLTYGTPAYWSSWETYVANYVDACVSRLSGYQRHYVVLNEPNIEGQTPAQVIEILQHTSPIIRAHDPNCLIIGPNLVALDWQSYKDYFDDLLGLGLANYIDALGLHAYLTGMPAETFYEQHVDYYLNAAASYGINGRPWFTEQGVMGSLEQTPTDAAGELQRQILLAMFRNAATYNYFSLTDYPTTYPGKPDGLQHFGLYERRSRAPRTGLAADEYMPKASALAYATLTKLFRGTTYASSQKTTSGSNAIYRVDYYRSGQPVTALWSTPGNASYTYTSAIPYYVYDSMGNITDTKAGGQSTTLTLSTNPQFVYTDVNISPPSITVTAPNTSSVNVGVGDWYNVTWTSSGTVGNVDIQFSSDGGSTWTTVASNTPNDGNQGVYFPNAPSTTCRVRIQEPDGSPSDISDVNFTLKSLTVTYPNGGQVLTGGSSATVTWTSLYYSGTVDIQLSTNGGSTWTTLVSGTANDGTQTVTLPATPSTNCRIRVQGLYGTPKDTSNSAFTIQ